MAETERSGQSRQIGLRKLFLWTVVLALYLGCARATSVSVVSLAELAAFLAIITILRIVAGPLAAAVGSLVAFGFGFLAFALVDFAFVAIDWVDARFGKLPEDVTRVHQAVFSCTEYRFAFGALLVALLGSVVPITALVELWRSPMRPEANSLNLAIAKFWCSPSTPVVVIWLCVLAVQEMRRTTRAELEKLLLLYLIAFSLVVAFLPLLLSTYGIQWVIQDCHF